MHRSAIPMLAVAMALAMGAPGEAQAPPSPTKAQIIAAIQAARLDPEDATKVSAVLAVLPKVVRQEGGAQRTYYLWEGDQLLTASQVRTALRGKKKSDDKGPASPELVVMLTAEGKDAIWPKGQRAFTYAVNRASFPSQAKYDLVVRDLKVATKDWVDACPSCGVSFTHKAALDTGRSFPGVTFVVHYDPGETRFVAAAFFPNDPVYRRQVIIAPGFYTMEFSTAGVLRHEIGHVLGYRHEHIQDVAGCDFEDNQWRPVTPYNPKSVMHYMCGGGGTFDLNLQPDDKSGHVKLYS